MDTDTLKMLRSSLTHVLTEDPDTEDPDTALSERLRALGWEDVLEDDAASALRTLFEVKGGTLSAADALGPVLARSIAESVPRPELAGATVILPSSLHPDRLSSRIDGDDLVVEGTATTTLVRDVAVVPVGGADGVRLAVVPAGASWSGRSLAGTDPSLGLTSVAAVIRTSDCDWIDAGAAPGAWAQCTARARWVLAAELVGIGHRVIEHAVDYTGQRHQYGRPIGSFQALQHRLASAHASVVGAADVVAEASSSGSPWDALVAKSLAGRAAENACTQAQQSYGAIGFTWEHELHRYLRRTYVLDWLFGDWRTLEREIGNRLLETHVVPRIGSL